MKKKHVTIDINFYGDESDQIMHEPESLTSKSLSSAIDRFDSELDSSIKCSSYSQNHQLYLQQQAETKTDLIEIGEPPNIRKLRATFYIQNIISRMAATLFISCWDSLKHLLTQQHVLYRRLGHDTHRILKKSSAMKNLSNESQHNNHKTNLSTQEFETNHRKKQILSRQQNGITLSSLQKIRKSGSKSFTQEEKLIQTNQNQLSYNNSISMFGKSQESLQKGYRQKFEESKERNKSKQGKNEYKETKSKDFSINHKANSQSYRQSSHHKYFLNYPSEIEAGLNRIFSYKSHLKLDQHQRPPIQRQPNQFPYKGIHKGEQGLSQYENLMRARLLDEISDKLNYSKMKIQNVSLKNESNIEIIRKIQQLKNLIIDFRIQEEKNHRNQIKNVEKTTKNHQKQQQDHTSAEEVYLNKLVNQVTMIRQQINKIKISKPEIPPVQSHPSHLVCQSHQTYKQIQTFNTLLRKNNHFSITKQINYQNIAPATTNEPQNINQRQVRQDQIRLMVERVRKIRQEAQTKKEVNRQRREKIRQKCQKKWIGSEKDHREQTDSDDRCCRLLDY